MYSEWLKDKRVALVGPGSQTELMKLGSLIDSYDIVARVGWYSKLIPDEIGSRTDLILDNFWYWDGKHPLDMENIVNQWESQGVKWVNHIWPKNPGLAKFMDISHGRFDVNVHTDEECIKARSSVDSPTKGFIAIWDLLQRPIAELFLTGFSFSMGFGYRKEIFENENKVPTPNMEYVDPKYSVHNLDKWTCDVIHHDHKLKQELDWFRHLNDKHVKCDEWLEKIKCG